jgi:hypothetical protein
MSYPAAETGGDSPQLNLRRINQTNSHARSSTSIMETISIPEKKIDQVSFSLEHALEFELKKCQCANRRDQPHWQLPVSPAVESSLRATRPLTAPVLKWNVIPGPAAGPN